MTVDADGVPAPVDEIQRFQDSRYVSACESAWRILGYSLQKQWPSVYRLGVHLPGAQWITFRENDVDLENALREQEDTILTSWFKLNERDEHARQYLYTEIANHCTYNSRTRTWTRRGSSQIAVGRLYFVQPRDVERFALRLLLLHVRGATSYRYLRTTPDGVVHPTFHEAAIARGLLHNGNELDELLEEFSLFQTSAREFRKLFAMMFALRKPSYAARLWEKDRPELAADFFYQQQQQGRARDEESAYVSALIDVDYWLERHGESLASIRGMPHLSPEAWRAHSLRSQPLIERERRKYDSELLRRLLPELADTLNDDKRSTFASLRGANGPCGQPSLRSGGLRAA